MVSLRPLLRFSRAFGRQVFPVDGSGGRERTRGTRPGARTARQWGTGSRAEPGLLSHTSSLNLFPISPQWLRGRVNKRGGA